jgi:DnaK suppressor protein|tara:strand:- start:1895 stop:2332 length:438 start_codon:yes stop_codon:yes gene_type:complete
MNLVQLKREIMENGPKGEEYLSDRQIELFGKYFDFRLDELEPEIKEKELESKNVQIVHADPVDKAESQAELDRILLRINQLKDEQKSILKAIKRIESGDFGYCLKCGDEIGLPRLLVNPCFVRDTECHTLYEIEQKQKGLPVYSS